MLVAAFSTLRVLVYGALVLGGAAWMAVMSTFNTATQTSAPPWVRSRATSLHTLSALGSFAHRLGVLGRAVRHRRPAGRARCRGGGDDRPALLLARPVPAAHGRGLEVTPAAAGTAASSPTSPIPRPGRWRWRSATASGPSQPRRFCDSRAARCARRASATARPSGALYRDLGDASRYVERFIVTCWADYLHQRHRGTVADREVEAGLREYLVEGSEVETRHYLAER